MERNGETTKRTGGQLIVEALKANGVKRVSCVPGESYLAVLDALYESGIDVLVCRQEGGAAMMADTWGRLSGEPGICMVTRGPGATNASAGLHVAKQDSIPMILFVGQIGRDMKEREAFQEVEYRRAFTEGTAGSLLYARRKPSRKTADRRVRETVESIPAPDGHPRRYTLE